MESSDSRRPATELGRRVALGLRARRVLVSRDGPAENVLKFKPPMVFTENDAATACNALRESIVEACEALGWDPKVGSLEAKPWVPEEELAVDLDTGAAVGSLAAQSRQAMAEGGSDATESKSRIAVAPATFGGLSLAQALGVGLLVGAAALGGVWLG